MGGLIKGSRSCRSKAAGAQEPLIFDQTQTICLPGNFHPRFLKILGPLTRG